MALNSFNPQYSEIVYDWYKLRDCYDGESAIKGLRVRAGRLSRDLDYLPATPGQNLDGLGHGQLGRQNYDAYKNRAVFPSFVSEAVKAMIGVMHNKPAVIELPSALEPLRERATVTGESLNLLLRRINEAQLITGRIGLLLDLPAQGNPQLPYVVTYEAEHVINWDDGAVDNPTLQTLNLVVLDESDYERNVEFEWRMVNQYRVLVLGDPEANETAGLYQQALFRETTTFNPALLMTPSIRGNTLQQIPFVFVNSTDLLPEPINPPLLQLADLCLAIYRGEADYRQNLFMQAQDTLVTIGELEREGDVRVGAGGHIKVPVGGDAKFIGVGSAGLGEQRSALENDRRRAAELGAQLLDATSRQKESGEALHIRVAAQTATLNQIALAGAEALQRILRIAAEWIGADPKAVTVSPNLDFANAGASPADVLQIAQAKASGAPISDESFHAYLKESEYTVMEFADEMALIEQERQAAIEQQARVFNAGFGGE